MKEESLHNLKNLISKILKFKSEKDIPSTSNLVMKAPDLKKYINTSFLGCSSEKHITELYHLINTLRFLGCQAIISEESKLSEDKFPAAFWLIVICPEETEKILLQTFKKVENLRTEMVYNNTYLLMSDELSDIMFLSIEIEIAFKELMSKKKSGGI